MSGSMMLRRLLACLALMTGLAAASAPAQANLAEAFGTQLEASEKNEQREAKQHCECQHDKRGKRDRRASARPCEKSEPVRIFLPTVQLGIDLSLE